MHFTALQNTELYCTALNCPSLHYTELPCTALHCTVLHCTNLKNTGTLGSTIQFNLHKVLLGSVNFTNVEILESVKLPETLTQHKTNFNFLAQIECELQEDESVLMRLIGQGLFTRWNNVILSLAQTQF